MFQAFYFVNWHVEDFQDEIGGGFVMAYIYLHFLFEFHFILISIVIIMRENPINKRNSSDEFY